MIETESDTRAMFDTGDFALSVKISGGPDSVIGIFDQNFDQTYEINGRRTGFRIYIADLVDLNISVGSVLIFNHNQTDESSYTVRAIERGARTALLILEQL